MTQPSSHVAKNIGRATLLMMIALIASKVTGQLRTILVANRIGYGALNDAYVQGFLIPDFLYELLIGGSIQAVIIPTLSGALGTKNEQKVWRSISIFISFACLCMLSIVLLCELFAPTVMHLFTRAETHVLATDVARRIFPQTFFMMAAALCIGVLNAHHLFQKTAFGPVFYNVLVIIVLVVFGGSNVQAVRNVAVGVTVSAFLYFLMQYIVGFKQLHLFKPSLDFKDQQFRRLLILAIPTLISSSIPQINFIFLNTFTKQLPLGTPAALQYASTLWMLPWGVFSIAVANVMLPSLSRCVAQRRPAEGCQLLSSSLKKALFLTTPFAVTFYFMREEVVRAVFQWQAKRFDEQAVQATSQILMWYCIAIFTMTFVSIMNQAFYAVKRTYMPLLNGILSLLLTVLIGYFMSKPQLLGASGLSLGYAIGSICGALFLLLSFKYLYPQYAPRGLVIYLFKLSICTLSMLIIYMPYRILLYPWHPTHKLTQLLSLVVISVIGFILYGAVAHFLKMKQIQVVTRRIAEFKKVR